MRTQEGTGAARRRAWPAHQWGARGAVAVALFIALMGGQILTGAHAHSLFGVRSAAAADSGIPCEWLDAGCGAGGSGSAGGGSGGSGGGGAPDGGVPAQALTPCGPLLSAACTSPDGGFCSIPMRSPGDRCGDRILKRGGF